MQDHRKLRVWQQARELAIAIRRASREFPRMGYSSLQTQITRAAESIVFNIAEGCGTTSQRELARFLDIAIKSTKELEAQVELAKDYGALRTNTWELLSPRVVDVRRMLCGLRAKVLAADATPKPRPHPDAVKRQKTENGERRTENGKRQTWIPSPPPGPSTRRETPNGERTTANAKRGSPLLLPDLDPP